MANVKFRDIATEVGVAKQGDTEFDEIFAERILSRIDKLDDKEWDDLSRTTQEWYNSFGEKP